MKKPDIDIGACTLCMVPEKEVDEAIMYCPEDCIVWQEE
jgi:hypothetical protein